MSQDFAQHVLYLVPAARDVGLTSVALGLVQALQRDRVRVGFAKPILQPDEKTHDNVDLSTHFARTLLHIAAPDPIPFAEAESRVRAGQTDALLEDIASTLEAARAGCDVVVVEGLIPDAGLQVAAQLNAAMARSLSARLVPVLSGDYCCTHGLEECMQLAMRQAGGNAPQLVAGILVNKVHAAQATRIQDGLARAQGRVPVLKSEEDTFATASRLAGFRGHVSAEDGEQMQRVLGFIAEHVGTAPLREAIGQPRRAQMPPPAFRHRLVQAARKANKRIVLPEGDEPRTIEAAAICQRKGIARCVLLGDPAKIRQVAEARGVPLPPDIEIVHPDEARPRYVAPMVELRRSKGLTAPQAEKQLDDTVVLGTMMLAQGDVDGLVSGAVHTTANTVRPALQLIKTAPGAAIVSSVFFMLMPDEVLVYGDCAINPNPTAEELADIALQSADSARAFGIEPRVAMISYSTGNSGSGDDVEKVRAALRIAREKRPDLLIDGPMQYDAATVESVGRQKAPDSPMAGRANVFIFPDLNTGNTTYKAVQRSANVVSVGPMLQGLRKPVNDLSRGALVDDIVYTIALTAIQADQPKEAKAAPVSAAA